MEEYYQYQRYGYENKQFYPIYVSKECNEDVLNLLPITKDEKKHYVLIKDLNRPWPDQHSGSLNNWEESAAFVMTSANG